MRSTGRRGPSPALAVAIALLAFTAAAFVDLEMVSFASAAGPNKLAPARGPERLARKNNTMKVNFLVPNIVDGRPVSPPFSYPWAVPILDTDYKPDINAMVGLSGTIRLECWRKSDFSAFLCLVNRLSSSRPPCSDAEAPSSPPDLGSC